MDPVTHLGRKAFTLAIIAAFAVQLHSAPCAADELPVAELSGGTESLNHFGAMLDFGVPDALGISFVGRPWHWLRLHVGPSTNAVSAGVRGGATVVPFQYWISPSFTFEGGHMFEGDANTLTKMFGVESEALEKIGYTYLNVHGGVELGWHNRFLFFIHAGISYAVTTVHNLQNVVQKEVGDTSITFTNPTGEYFGISGKIGFVLYI